MDAPRIEAGQKALTRMLITFWAGGYIRLDPPPPEPKAEGQQGTPNAAKPNAPASEQKSLGSFGSLLSQARTAAQPAAPTTGKQLSVSVKVGPKPDAEEEVREIYQPRFAYPTPELARLLVFRSVNPLYGAFLVQHLGIADRDERIQALESVLEVPTSILRDVRVPRMKDLPPGPLAMTSLDGLLMERGLVTAEQLRDKSDDEGLNWEERWTPTLAEKLRMLFDSEFPDVHDLVTRPVWIAGEVLRYGGDFNKLITSKGIVRQEGIVFRHLLRFILLCGEFSQTSPPDIDPEVWRAELRDLADAITNCCRAVDPESTDKAIETAMKTPDVIRGEQQATPEAPKEIEEDAQDFGVGLEA